MNHATFFGIARLCFSIVAVDTFLYTKCEVMRMDILARIKTGFFEIKPYRLKAEEGSLLLVPLQESGGDAIVLTEGDILSVTLTEGRLPELEIQTRNELYSGILEESCSLEEVINYLKKSLNINITCEYKGGN